MLAVISDVHFAGAKEIWFILHTPEKKFKVMPATVEDKNTWITNLEKCINDCLIKKNLKGNRQIN